MSERRHNPRYRIIADLLVRLEEREISAMAINLSRMGIRFVCNEELEIGTTGEIELKEYVNEFLTRNDIDQFRQRVKILAVDEDKTYPDMKKYSCIFRKPLGDDYLERLRKPFGV